MSKNFNWKKLQDHSLVNKRSKEVRELPKFAAVNDCPVHYRLNCKDCKECKETLRRKEIWENRKQPHSSEGTDEICGKCFLPSFHTLHGSDLFEAVKAAKEQRKLWKKYMDSL